MSNSLTKTPGLHQVVPIPDAGIPWAAKVTGRNLGAITYMVSLSAEHGQTPRKLSVKFGDNGVLKWLNIDGARIGAGNYVLLKTDGEVFVLSPTEYDRYFIRLLDD